MAMSDLGVMLGKIVLAGVNRFTSIPFETQEKILLQIMDENKDTEYGKKIGFKDVHSIEDFQRIVPLSTYDTYDNYVERMLNGEENLMMARKCKRYCSSSGSVGKPKVLPKSGKDLWNMQCMGFAATPACASRWFKEQGMKFPKQVGPVAILLPQAHSAQIPDSSAALISQEWISVQNISISFSDVTLPCNNLHILISFPYLLLS